MSSFQERDRGWTLIETIHLEMSINQYKTLRGSGYIQLPECIFKKCVTCVYSVQ